MAPTGHPNLLSDIGSQIDWALAPQRLQAGDLSTLDPRVAEMIRDAATVLDVIALADALGVDPVVLVIGLLARAVTASDRSAARIARAILGSQARHDVDRVERALGERLGG